MTDSELNDAARLARSILQDVGDAGIRGADLGKRLRDDGFSVKPDYAGLRAFLADRVPEAEVIGRSGQDPIFALRVAGESDSAERSPARHARADLWRVWLSPGAPYSLIVDLGAGVVRAGEPTAATAGETVLPSPDATIHRSIAADFLGSDIAPSSPGSRDALQAALADESPDWWLAWRRALGSGDVAARWGSYRASRFQQHLLHELQRVGADDDHAARVVAAVAGTRSTGHTASVPRSRQTTATPRHDPELDLLVCAIRGMPAGDRREVRVAFGVIVDALVSLGWTPPRSR